MTKILIMGDTHGYTKSYLRSLEFAKSLGIAHVFQMGDCGTFPEDDPTWVQEHLENVNEFSRRNKIINYWIRGNHDDTDMWQAIIDNFPTQHKGMGYLRSNIRLTPRVGYFKMFGLRFLEVGGAVSIDAAWRRKLESWQGGYINGQYHHKGKGPRTLWWPDEAISYDDIAKVTDRKVDILMSHECSNYTPFYGRFKPDPDSEVSRRNLDMVLKKSRPDFHFHGHMHTQYDWENYMVHEMNHSTRTIGLECNSESMYNKKEFNNFVVFDTETKQISWKADINE